MPSTVAGQGAIAIGQWSRGGPLAIEHPPTDRVAQPLVIQHKIANRHRQPLTLPAALAPASTTALALRSSSLRCLDRIGSGTEVVGCNVGDRPGLASGVRCVSRSSGQLSGCGIGMASCRARLSHRAFAARPRSSLLHRTARPRIHGPDRLEERQYVLSAFGRPFSEKPMMRVFQCASATDGDESRIALLGKDHSSAPPLHLRQRCADPPKRDSTDRNRPVRRKLPNPLALHKTASSQRCMCPGRVVQAPVSGSDFALPTT